ncbi:MAG: 50S ribosomal protein L6 [Phycisphaerae bacterium]
MSRIGKKPIEVPDGVKVSIAGSQVSVSGPKTKAPLVFAVPSSISAKVEDDGKRVVVTRANDQKPCRSLHGLSRALIANMVHGAHVGYERRLLIFGTGYSCKVQGQSLQLNVGFMGRGSKDKPQFTLPIPEGLEVAVETPAARGNNEPAKFVVRGADKHRLGEFCAQVRALRPPEPYLGKGIRYDNETVIRKAGKAFAGSGG